MRTIGHAMRMPDELRDCVVYLTSGGTPIGTGVLLGVPLEAWPDQGLTYVVTAGHLIGIQPPPAVQVNLVGGGTETIEIGDRWRKSDEPGTDVAVAHVGLDRRTHAVRLLPRRWAADDAFLAERKVGVGDEVAFVGLFSEAPGTETNRPIVRFGQIARMALAARLVAETRITPESAERWIAAWESEARLRGLDGRSGAWWAPAWQWIAEQAGR